jgi:peptide/nickel transport system substrate-binding protein
MTDLKRGNFQLAMLKWMPVIDPDLLRLAYHSRSIPTEASGWGGGNRMRYRNAALDALLDEGRRSSIVEERRAAYVEAQRILAEDLPALPLLHEDALGVMSRRVRGVAVDPQGSFQSLAAARLVP